MGVRMVDGKIVTDADMPLGEAMQDVDDQPPGDLFSDAKHADFSCETCGEPLTYSGRGRYPRFCADHKPNARQAAGTQPKRGGTLRNEDALRAALLERYMQLGALASFIHPAYGMGIKQRAEQAVDADLEYAKVSPTFRRSLQSLIEKSALGVVIAVHASMLAPIIVGERAKAARKQAERQGAPRNTQPTATAPPRPNAQVFTFPNAESEKIPETVNAATMPGMPG